MGDGVEDGEELSETVGLELIDRVRVGINVWVDVKVGWSDIVMVGDTLGVKLLDSVEDKVMVNLLNRTN